MGRVKQPRRPNGRQQAELYWIERLGADVHEVRMVCRRHDPKWVADAVHAARAKEQVTQHKLTQTELIEFVQGYLKKRIARKPFDG